MSSLLLSSSSLFTAIITVIFTFINTSIVMTMKIMVTVVEGHSERARKSYFEKNPYSFVYLGRMRLISGFKAS